MLAGKPHDQSSNVRRDWSHTVSTVKKSTAMMLLACVRRNSRHDGLRRTRWAESFGTEDLLDD
jgi:hypothetical protein